MKTRRWFLKVLAILPFCRKLGRPEKRSEFLAAVTERHRMRLLNIGAPLSEQSFNAPLDLVRIGASQLVGKEVDYSPNLYPMID